MIKMYFVLSSLHEIHLVCHFCLKPLSKGCFKEQDNKPYCHPCFIKLFVCCGVCAFLCCSLFARCCFSLGCMCSCS
uniref:LIM zinc-binding domain-containing protein n=1 Tax=Cyprinus carpio TaxID=7962 RepID=A0A8C1X482_CYPCA